MQYRTLIGPAELAENLEDPQWIIVDCRFDLDDEEAGHRAYLHSHIPGAVYGHLNRDLSGEITPEAGRHPLPDWEEFKETLGRWGIDSTKQVVAYDNRMGAIAARLWWMLKYLGHQTVAVLDGGFPRWEQEGYPLATGEETNPRAVFELRSDLPHNWMASPEEVEEFRRQSDTLLIDSRSPERYRGEEEPHDPVAGHIPGAVNYYFGENVDEGEKFLPPAQLRQKIEELLGHVPAEKTLFYCGSGVTACHNLLVMEHLGYKGARLYPGSWSQWISDPSRPRSEVNQKEN